MARQPRFRFVLPGQPHGEVGTIMMRAIESDPIGHYRGLFQAHLDPDKVKAIRTATNGNYVLGDNRFQKEIEQMLNRRVTPGLSGRPAKSS